MANRQQKQLADLQKKLETAQQSLEEKKKANQDATSESRPIRRERGFNTIESQQVRTQIQILRQKIEECNLKIKAKEREAEEIEEKTKTEIQVYKQKVKHLMHTHQKDLAKIEADKKSAQEAQQAEANEIQKTHEVETFMEIQGHHAMQLKQRKEEYERQKQRLQEQYAKKLAEIDEEHHENMETLYEDADLQRINELHEIQERKDHHIRRLIKSYEKSFNEMRNFYNKITQDHISFIAQYDAEIADMARRLKEYEQRRKQYQKEIDDLKKQLEAKKQENNNLHKILSTYESDKMALANSRARIKSLSMEIEGVKHQHGLKETKFKRMEQERDTLLEKFEASVHDVKQKTEFRALLLEKKVETLDEGLQRKEGQLNELLETEAGLNDEQLEEISQTVSDVLSSKNQMIEDLEYELAKATKAHNDLIAIYQAKLAAAGVPQDELNFEPLPTDTTTAPAPALFQ